MSNRKPVLFDQIRFHQVAQILGKALSSMTPLTHPAVSVRETPSGDYEFVEFDKKTGMNKVAWVPTSTIESITYYEALPKADD